MNIIQGSISSFRIRDRDDGLGYYLYWLNIRIPTGNNIDQKKNQVYSQLEGQIREPVIQ